MWFRREGERDFQQPLSSVGELSRRTVAIVTEPERTQNRIGLINRVPIPRKTTQERGRVAAALAHCERDGFERVQVGKQRVDLEGANQAALDPMLRLQARDVLFAEQDLTAVRLKHSRHQVDEGRLPCAVRADQGIAYAARQADLDVACHDERAEALVQLACRKNRRHACFLRRRAVKRESPPRTPPGRNITTATSRMPIGKYQSCGLMPENWSRATMKMMAPISPP